MPRPPFRHPARHAWVAVLALAAPALHAQAPRQPLPGAGSVLRATEPGRAAAPAPAAGALPQLAPAPAAPAAAGPAFVLRQVRFTGNSVFAAAELAPLVAPALGRRVRFADLQALAARVARFYQDAGYPLTQVVLPPQDVTAGTVEFSVVEGRLGRVRLEQEGALPLAPDAVRARLAALAPGRPLQGAALERTLLLLNDTPGLVPQASLEPGDVPGSFDLALNLRAAAPFNYSVDADNYGARATRAYRVGAFVRANSPFGIGDNLDVRVLGTPRRGLGYGRLGYEAPLGAAGLRASLSFARLDYELGKELAALDASGSAEVSEAALSYPVLRARSRNLFARLAFERKLLSDQLGALQLSSDKSIRAFSAGLVYEQRDALWGGGYTSAACTAYLSRLRIGSPTARALDQGPGGPDTAGHSLRLVYQVSRLQALGARSTLLVALAGQVANRNLDSADKLAAGGPQAVRAYSPTAGLGDQVHVLNAEWRWSVRPELSASLFWDAGWVRFAQDPQPGVPNRQTLRGLGAGLFWTPAAGLSLRATLAWRTTGAEAGGADRLPRLYAQVAQTF